MQVKFNRVPHAKFVRGTETWRWWQIVIRKVGREQNVQGNIYISEPRERDELSISEKKNRHEIKRSAFTALRGVHLLNIRD